MEEWPSAGRRTLSSSCRWVVVPVCVLSLLAYFYWGSLRPANFRTTRPRPGHLYKADPATVSAQDEEQGALPFCTGDQYRRGSWIKFAGSPQYDICARHLHRNCAAIDNFNHPNGSTRIGLSLQWRWRPHDCSLRAVAPESLLEILAKRGRKIRYVGDSLNTDMSQSMQCLLGQEHEHLVSNVREDRLGCPTDVPLAIPNTVPSDSGCGEMERDSKGHATTGRTGG